MWHVPRSNWMRRESTGAHFTLKLANSGLTSVGSARFKSPLAHQGWISGGFASLAVGGFALSAGLAAIRPCATASRSAALRIVWQYLTVLAESPVPDL